MASKIFVSNEIWEREKKENQDEPRIEPTQISSEGGYADHLATGHHSSCIQMQSEHNPLLFWLLPRIRPAHLQNLFYALPLYGTWNYRVHGSCFPVSPSNHPFPPTTSHPRQDLDLGGQNELIKDCFAGVKLGWRK